MKRLFIIILTFLLFTASPLLADDTVMIVLDLSGSMWGKVDGKPKVEIARESLKSMLKDWPADREVGLVAYGHRDKGDCNDIETIFKAGPLDKEAISKAVDNLNPKGMTPLSAAVKHAAEEIKYTEKKATVILISDGVETCKLDPCTIGSELEKLGVDFTAHVIGFDVTKIEDQKGLKCLAENTGGKFIPAANSSELNKALTTIKVATPLPTNTPLPPPTHTATPEPSVTAAPTETPQPKGKIIANESGVKGTKFEVQADGAPKMGGFISLFAAGKEAELAYAAVRDNDDKAGYQSGFMQLPFTTGDYKLIWKTQDQQIVAEKPLKIVDAEVKISAPTSVNIGTEFDIKLSGPDGLEGWIYLYAAGKEQNISYSAIHPNDEGAGYKNSKMRANGIAGKYVLKFKTNKDEEMASQEIEFTKPEILINGPDEIPLATKATFTVTAPDGIEGYLYLYAQGKKNSISYKGVREKPAGGYEPMELEMPAVAGNFEVRWVTSGDDVIATKVFKVTDAKYSISAPGSAAAKSDIQVLPVGPPGFEGYLYIYAKGKKDSISYKTVREGKIKDYDHVNMDMPDEPGTYEIKLETNSREVLATTEIIAE